MENNIIKAGTKIVINTFACIGAEDCTAYILERDYTSKELEDIAWQEGLQHAESYGIYFSPHYEDEPNFDEDGDEYSEDIEGWWELYNSDEHDGKLIFGANNTFKFNSL